jgi:hypothetical protein
MHIKIFFLLFLLQGNAIYSMKREREDTTIISPKKKQKPNNSLITFFASNTQLKNAWKKIAKKAKNNGIPYDNPKKYPINTIVGNTPLDIKKNIAQQSIFSNQQWWYTTHKKTYQEIPHAVSFIDNDTLIVGFYDGTLEIVNLVAHKRLLSLKTDKNLLAIASNKFNNTIACGFNDGSVEIFKIHTSKEDLIPKQESLYALEPLREFITNSPSPVWSLAFTSANDILIGKENGTITGLSCEGKELFSRQTNSRVYGLIDHSNQKSFIYGLMNGELSIQDRQTNTITSSHSLSPFKQLLSLSSNNDEKTYIIGLDDGIVLFINTNNKRTINNFNLHAAVYSLSLSSSGDQLAAGLKNNTIHILKHYASPTPDQIMLKKIMCLWYQVKKPYKHIYSAESLLYTIAYQFKLDHMELIKIWNTLPKEMQNAIWLHIKRIINKYGKQ